MDIPSIETFQKNVYQEWLNSVEAMKGSQMVQQMVERYGFTGPFTGLDKVMTKGELIRCLEYELDEWGEQSTVRHPLNIPKTF